MFCAIAGSGREFCVLEDELENTATLQQNTEEFYSSSKGAFCLESNGFAWEKSC